MNAQGVMLQFFHWHSRGDGTLWSELAQRAEELQKSGFTSLWIPPCYKCAGGIHDRGYTPYDLFDLGEFDQKGSEGCVRSPELHRLHAKRFETGLHHASFRDATGHLGELIQTDEHGAAEFRCPGRSVSVWLQQ